MSSNISSTTLQSWRERPPSSYYFKVKNFSELVSSTIYSDGKYQSRSFSSGDYKWRLIIYPKGNEEDNGCGFISMYVEIDSTSLISTTQTEVYADVRFFIFNKMKNKYFTIEDVEPKLFNSLKLRCGLSQVILLDTFSDHINGYLFDGDHCEFGVDITFAPPPTKLETISFDVKLSSPKFSWTVKNFSEIKDNPYKSDIFTKGGMKWVLELYPKGWSSPDSKWLSIFLTLDGSETLKEDEKIYVQANVKIKDPVGSNDRTYQIDEWYSTGFDSGWDHFISTSKLRRLYLDKDDSLKVEVEFKIISETIFSS